MNELPVVAITFMARTDLKANLEWLLGQKQQNIADLRNNQTCLFVLSCFFFISVPEEVKYLLFHKQKAMKQQLVGMFGCLSFNRPISL